MINHGSVHHAGFLGEAAIYALSHDEVFSIHPVNSPDQNAVEPVAVQFGDLRTMLRCDYVIQLIGVGGETYVAAGSTRFLLLSLPLSTAGFDGTNSSIFRF